MPIYPPGTVFSITVQVIIRACSFSDSSHKEWVTLLRQRGGLDSYSHLSILTRRLLLVVNIVESVEKLSPDSVDKSDITASVVENVEKLSPFFVDNSNITA